MIPLYTVIFGNLYFVDGISDFCVVGFVVLFCRNITTPCKLVDYPIYCIMCIDVVFYTCPMCVMAIVTVSQGAMGGG